MQLHATTAEANLPGQVLVEYAGKSHSGALIRRLAAQMKRSAQVALEVVRAIAAVAVQQQDSVYVAVCQYIRRLQLPKSSHQS